MAMTMKDADKIRIEPDGDLMCQYDGIVYSRWLERYALGRYDAYWDERQRTEPWLRGVL